MSTLANDRCGGRPITGRVVLLSLIAFFAIISLANGIMIRFAVTTFGGVETSSSYQAGLKFSRENAAVRAQDALHWQVNASAHASAGRTVVTVTARDASGGPISGLTATAVLSHPLDRRADETITLGEESAGNFRGTTVALSGQRDLVIEFSRNGERLFRSRNRIVLR
jgi:nitrogen fixation protein FixH